MTNEILLLEYPREARSASSACVVERTVYSICKIVLADQDYVDCLCFVAGQSEMITDTAGNDQM